MNVSADNKFEKLDLSKLEIFFDKLSKSDLTSVVFTWHGGEPLLLPIEYFRNVLDLQKSYLNRMSYSNIIQTNAYYLQKEYIGFLRDENFHVGVSIDGPTQYCNEMRFTSLSQFDKVLGNIYLAKEEGLDFSLFIVVHKRNFNDRKAIFDFIKDLKPSKGVVLNPLFDLSMKELMINENEYFELLKEFYEYLIANDIDIKNNIISSVKMGLEEEFPRLCYFSDRCRNFISVNSVGNMYATCLEDDNYCLGNVLDDSFNSILEKTDRFMII